MEHYKVEFTDKLSKATEEQVRQSFIDYETSHGIDVNYKKFAILFKDDSDHVFAVLQAYTAFSEIYIDDLWVDKPFRGKGYGRLLIQELETHFKGKGFNNINLVTNAFQAPEFYKKCGFIVEFVRQNTKNPKLTKTFFVKYFEDIVQMQGILQDP